MDASNTMEQRSLDITEAFREPLDSEGVLFQPDTLLYTKEEAREKLGFPGAVLAKVEIPFKTSEEGSALSLKEMYVYKHEKASGGHSYGIFEVKETFYDALGNKVAPEFASGDEHMEREYYVHKLEDGQSYIHGRNSTELSNFPSIKDNKVVSRNHVEFSVGEHGVSVRDMETANGTFITPGKKFDVQSSPSVEEAQQDSFQSYDEVHEQQGDTFESYDQQQEKPFISPPPFDRETREANRMSDTVRFEPPQMIRRSVSPPPLARRERWKPKTSEERKFDVWQGKGVNQRTNNLLSHQQLVPSIPFQVGDSVFRLTSVFEKDADSRKFAVLYHEEKGLKVDSRLLYKSKSEGGWRVASGVEVSHKSDGSERLRYIKGSEAHYTQETKLNDAVVDNLMLHEEERLVRDPAIIDTIVHEFKEEYIDAVEAWEKEHELIEAVGKLDQLSGLTPGRMTRNDFERFVASKLGVEKAKKMTNDKLVSFSTDFYNQLLRKNRKFVPNFKKEPLRTVERDHSELGSVTYSDFPARMDGEDIFWRMAEDAEGRVWVDAIEFEEQEVNSYGANNRTIDSGMLTSKPLDYMTQTGGIPDSLQSQYNGLYSDITPMLAQLSPINKYKKYKKRRATKK